MQLTWHVRCGLTVGKEGDGGAVASGELGNDPFVAVGLPSEGEGEEAAGEGCDLHTGAACAAAGEATTMASLRRAAVAFLRHAGAAEAAASWGFSGLQSQPEPSLRPAVPHPYV